MVKGWEKKRFRDHETDKAEKIMQAVGDVWELRDTRNLEKLERPENHKALQVMIE